MIPLFDTSRLSKSLEQKRNYSLDEILDGMHIMIEARNYDIESWCSGDCEDIAKSILALSGGCDVYEVRTDEFRGIHFYAVIDGVPINEGGDYDSADWGETLRHEKVDLSPSLDAWGEELKAIMDKARSVS